MLSTTDVASGLIRCPRQRRPGVLDFCRLASRPAPPEQSIMAETSRMDGHRVRTHHAGARAGRLVFDVANPLERGCLVGSTSA